MFLYSGFSLALGLGCSHSTNSALQMNCSTLVSSPASEVPSPLPLQDSLVAVASADCSAGGIIGGVETSFSPPATSECSSGGLASAAAS